MDLKNRLMWGVFLTFFMKSYLKFYIIAIMGTTDESKSQSERLVPFCLLLILTAAPIFMVTGLINMRYFFERPDLK